MKPNLSFKLELMRTFTSLLPVSMKDSLNPSGALCSSLHCLIYKVQTARVSHRRAFILPHRPQVVKHFFLAFFGRRRPPGPISTAQQEALSSNLSPHANFYILARRSRFVKNFFQLSFGSRRFQSLLLLPSLERSITIPDYPPYCQHLFSLFLDFFQTRP